MSQISPEAGSVSTMIRSYKSAVTKRVRGTLRTDFGWQRRFHDHIVRSEQAFNAIRQYIVDNPSQWRQDEHHPSQIEEKAF
jgi:REP element-mobilizing transposase RayT